MKKRAPGIGRLFAMSLAMCWSCEGLAQPTLNKNAPDDNKSSKLASFQETECRFSIYFANNSPKLNLLSVNILQEAHRIALANGTRAIFVRRFDTIQRAKKSSDIIDEQKKLISNFLQTPESLILKFDDFIVADGNIGDINWYYSVDVCDDRLRAARIKAGPPSNAPPIKYSIAGAHLRIPPAYRPVVWADMPVIELKQQSLNIDTTWPDFVDGRDPIFSACKNNPFLEHCSKIITIWISEGRMYGDAPPKETFKKTELRVLGGDLYLSPFWPKNRVALIDLELHDKIGSTLFCRNMPDASRTQNLSPSEEERFISLLLDNTTTCLLNIRQARFPFRLAVSIHGTHTSAWPQIQDAVLRFVSGLADASNNP